MNIATQDLYTVAGAARELGLHPDTVAGYVSRRQIDYVTTADGAKLITRATIAARLARKLDGKPGRPPGSPPKATPATE